MAKEVKQPADDPQFKGEVKDAVADAKQDAKTGNVETVKESKGGPVTDLPTGHRRNLPPA